MEKNSTYEKLVMGTTDIDEWKKVIGSGASVRLFDKEGEPITDFEQIYQKKLKVFADANEGQKKESLQMPAEGYETLYDVLVRAHHQAAYGKGNERHATGQPFAEQPIMKLTELYGSGFPLGQAGKKMQESLRLPREAAVRELLGAINYIAAQIIMLERGKE